MAVRHLASLISVAAAAAAVTGCVGQLPPSGVELLRQVDQSYRQGEFRDTVVKAGEFLALHGGTEVAGEAYYLRGLAYANLKDRTRARQDFEQAMRVARRADLPPLAQTGLGHLAFEQGQWPQAAEHYRQAVEKLANEPPKDLVLLRMGQCYLRLGQWQVGQGWLAQLVHLFPASSLEPAARQHLAADAFAVQCGPYPDYERARRQVEELRSRGLATRWIQDPRTKHYVVLMGSYRTYQEARTGLAQVLPHAPYAIVVP